jgi:hypothetical protein
MGLGREEQLSKKNERKGKKNKKVKDQLAKKQDKKWEEGNTQNKGCLLCHLQT